VDVRVLAATNRDLPALVKQGLFARNLYYRLSIDRGRVPALRQRAGGRRPSGHALRGRPHERYGTEGALATAPWLSSSATTGRKRRELQHAIEAAMVVCDGEEIRPGTSPRPGCPRAPGARRAGRGGVPAHARGGRGGT